MLIKTSFCSKVLNSKFQKLINKAPKCLCYQNITTRFYCWSNEKLEVRSFWRFPSTSVVENTLYQLGLYWFLALSSLHVILKVIKITDNTSLLSPYLDVLILVLLLKYCAGIIFNTSKTRCHHEDIFAGVLWGAATASVLPSLPNNVWCKQRLLECTHLQYVHKENKQAEIRCCLSGIFCLCGTQTCVMWM